MRVFFELNGQPRNVKVPNRSAKAVVEARRKAEEGNETHVAAPMPGAIATIAVRKGEIVKQGDVLLTIEAMKMETALHAPRDGTVSRTPGHPRRPDRRQGSAGGAGLVRETRQKAELPKPMRVTRTESDVAAWLRERLPLSRLKVSIPRKFSDASALIMPGFVSAAGARIAITMAVPAVSAANSRSGRGLGKASPADAAQGRLKIPARERIRTRVRSRIAACRNRYGLRKYRRR